MGLEVSARFASQWIAQQMPKWHGWLAAAALDNGAIIPSQKAAGAARGAARPLAADDAFALPEWSASLPAMAFLLAKWATTLREPSKQRSGALLHALVRASLGSGQLKWHVPAASAGDAAWPPAASAEAVQIMVDAARIKVADVRQLGIVAHKTLFRTLLVVSECIRVLTS